MLRYNTKGLQVLTDSGFRPFAGVALTKQDAETLRFEFEDGSDLVVTPNHKFVVDIKFTALSISDGVEVHANSLNVGDRIATMGGDTLKITNIKSGDKTTTYDLVEVSDHKYKTNNVISHNCVFLSSDPLLVDSQVLANLEHTIEEPIREDMGFKFWQQLQPNKTYLLGVDPATGSSEDFTTMMLYDFQDLSLVAQFRSNTMSSPQAYGSLKMILRKIEALGSMTFFSVENNGVGEGIISLYQNDEHIPQNAEFVSEEGASRLGMRTENRAKLRACLVLKQMVESGKLQVKSGDLLKELRSYITHKSSYAAQIGATDDLISSLLIVIRLLEEMATYDQRAFDAVNDYDQVDVFASPGENEEAQYDENYVPDGMII